MQGSRRRGHASPHLAAGQGARCRGLCGHASHQPAACDGHDPAPNVGPKHLAVRRSICYTWNGLEKRLCVREMREEEWISVTNGGEDETEPDHSSEYPQMGIYTCDSPNPTLHTRILQYFP
jgi:hypothetical protein